METGTILTSLMGFFVVGLLGLQALGGELSGRRPIQDEITALATRPDLTPLRHNPRRPARHNLRRSAWPSARPADAWSHRAA